MTRRFGCLLLAVVLLLAATLAVLTSPRAEFLVGGALVNLGYRLQDRLAEAAAADPAMRERFPAMVSLLDERERRIDEFLGRPTIRDAIAGGTLQVKFARIDTETDRLVVEKTRRSTH